MTGSGGTSRCYFWAAWLLATTCLVSGIAPGRKELGGAWALGGLGGCGIDVQTPGAPKHAGVLAEPYRLTRFVITLSCSDGLDRDVVLRTRGPNRQVAFGREVFFNFTSKGRHEIEVGACPAEFADKNAGPEEAWCGSKLGAQVRRVPVAVTYVRREIRAIPREEREQYFDAVKIMGRLSTEEGRERYGPKYLSYQEIVAKHWAGVLAVPCDLGHWGPALVTYHRLAVKEFENAVQSIHPHLSQPYWDIFVDGELDDPAASEIWSDAYYGSRKGDAHDDWIVKDGQFAYWTVAHGAQAEYWANKTWGPEAVPLGPVTAKHGINPYGMMRSANNMNRGRYLTRVGVFGDNYYPMATYKNWTMCRDMPQFGLYSRCLDASSTHPALHMGLGGNSGLPLWKDVRPAVSCGGLTEHDCGRAFKFAQELSGPSRWTGLFEGCIVCDKKCHSFQQEPEECACTCTNELPRCDPGEVFRRTMSKLFIDPAKLPGYDGREDMVNKTKEFARLTVCAPGNAQGDYYDLAGSAWDPVFWPHHAMLDRLTIGYKMTYKSTPWTGMSFTFPSPDDAAYPDFLSTTNILEAALGEASKSMYAGVHAPGDRNPTGVCVGHGLHDTVARGAFSRVFDSLPADRPHTNWDVTRTYETEMNDIFGADYIYDTYQL